MLDDGGIIGVDGGASRRYWQIVSGCSSAPVSIVALLVLLLGRRRERGSRASSLCALLLVTTLSGCATFKTNAFVNDTTGTAVTLDELRGQVVVVNFWAEWCKACIIELPALAQVAEEKKAVLLPAYFTDKPRNPRFYEWLASQPPWFRERVVWADRSVRMGHDLSALPLTVVLARSDGQVVDRFVGTVSKSKL
ncbi:MAG: TlpA family protein disulfide reductase, partial [Archangium sp.]|nr:TlpA family protein disulfide reductase [Archangium sp.]